MKKKYILTATIVATLTILGSSSASASGLVEKKFDVKADQISNQIKVEHEGKKYLLSLNNVVSENQVTNSKKETVEEIKEIIVDTNSIEDIINKYTTLEFKDAEGNTSTLIAKEVTSIEIAGEDESYWETLETISKTITLTAAQVNQMGDDVKKLVENDKNYELTNAEFTPIEFKNNEPTLYSAKCEYTTVVPHHEKTINSYKAKIKYIGEVEKKNIVGYETVANYTIEEVNGANIPAIIGATTGVGAFVLIGWIFINNITLYSGTKRLKSYRKGKNIIEIDVTKEIELYENLNLVIKKRLSKRLDNTVLVIKANGNEIERTVLNAVNENMKIIIN